MTEQDRNRRLIMRKIAKREARREALRDVIPRPKRKSQLAEVIGGKRTYLHRQKEIEAKVAVRKPARFAEYAEIEKRLGRQRILRRARKRTERRAALRDAKPTRRTASIEKFLKHSGLTKKEIARLRDKKRQMPKKP